MYISIITTIKDDSLGIYPTIKSILNQSIYTQGFRHSNKREELHDKMANRDLIQQIGFNPFLSNQNNYAEDISIRDQFLKPLNTSEEREE